MRCPIQCDALFYILRSVNWQKRRYIGLATDVEARLRAHNAGQNSSTAAGRPWAIDVCVEFRTERLAIQFERYLKSGSGHAFAKRHFSEQ